MPLLYLANTQGHLTRRLDINLTLFHLAAAAMKILYDNRVVQRDMKPANILLHDPLGRENPPATELVVKVSDYGFSRILDSNGLLRTWCGTPSYFAPEVWFHPDFSDNYYADAASYRYKAKIDLFSVGVILYECYVGKHPFLVACALSRGLFGLLLACRRRRHSETSKILQREDTGGAG